jgi:hypothetical protein
MRVSKIGPFAAATLAALFATALSAQPSAPNRLATTRQAPDTFGVNAYSVTTVSAVAFFPNNEDAWYHTTGSFGRNGNTNTVEEFFASLDIPAGVIIDYIGLNSTTDTDGALGVALYERYADGTFQTVATFSSTVHGWGTDFNANPIGWLHAGNSGRALVLNIETASLPTEQFFGYVEVHWRRTVSAPPASPTFADVPPSDPGFQYIEALVASGITAGCGGGNYCPDATLTRRQMAVFLAKALGLHWPS